MLMISAENLYLGGKRNASLLKVFFPLEEILMVVWYAVTHLHAVQLLACCLVLEIQVFLFLRRGTS